MTRSVKILLLTLGALSFLSGIFLALNGSDFTEYFLGIFIGIVLIGSVFFYQEPPYSNNSE
jgi:uncharacterized membrane protein